MAAQFDLDCRGEPAEVKTVGAGPDEEGRFRQSILKRDALHDLVRQPVFERHDSGRVAGKDAIGEGVDPEKGQLHVGKLEPAGTW